MVTDTYLTRRRDASNILYIGSTNNLMRRVLGNYLGGIGGKTTQRIHNNLFEKNYINNVEISWKIVDNFKNEERDLRKNYLQKHGELPPWNKRI